MLQQDQIIETEKNGGVLTDRAGLFRRNHGITQFCTGGMCLAKTVPRTLFTQGFPVGKTDRSAQIHDGLIIVSRSVKGDALGIKYLGIS